MGEGGGGGGGQWSGGFGGRELNQENKTEVLKMIGQRSNVCQLQSPRTIFNSNMD